MIIINGKHVNIANFKAKLKYFLLRNTFEISKVIKAIHPKTKSPNDARCELSAIYPRGILGEVVKNTTSRRTPKIKRMSRRMYKQNKTIFLIIMIILGLYLQLELRFLNF